jgi:phage tail sheath protein FI
MATSYAHGIYSNTLSTPVIPPVQSAAGAITAVGRAPVYQLNVPCTSSGYASVVNVAIVCNNQSDFSTSFGNITSNFSKYGLAGTAYSVLTLFNAGPVYAINVFDPSAPGNNTTVTDATITFTDNASAIAAQVCQGSIVLTSGGVTLTNVANPGGVDFSVSYSADGNTCTIELQPSSSYYSISSATISYKAAVPTNVTNTTIAGGVDENGNRSGIAVIDNVYQQTGNVPMVCMASDFADDPTVFATGQAKVQSIGGQFTGHWLGQVSATAVPYWTGVEVWKTITANFVSEWATIAWPNGSLNGVEILGVNFLAGNFSQVTAQNGLGVPFWSPSNYPLPITATVAGTNGAVNVFLSQEDANSLNGIGVWTMRNDQGWISWGDNTSIYPTSTDPAWRWIPVNIMFRWMGNQLGLLLRPFRDVPGNLRNLTDCAASIKQFGNGLVAVGALNTFALTFPTTTNTVVTVEDGIYNWQLAVTPPIPMEQIYLNFFFDSNSLASWIEAVSSSVVGNS